MNFSPPADAGDYREGPDQSVEGRLERLNKLALIGMAIFVLLMILTASLVQVGGAVVGSGQLGVESRVKRVAHPTGGVINAIYVRDGQMVRKGQLLVKLDSQVAGLNADLSGRTVEQLLAQQARLTAEREGANMLSFSSELTGMRTASTEEAMAAERRLFSLRQNERANMRRQLEQRTRQLEEQIRSYRAQIVALRQQKVLIAPELKGVRELWDKGLVTINRLNQLERTAVDLDGSIASLGANIAQAGARISETREQLIMVDQNARSEAGTELSQIAATLNDQQVKSASASDQFSRSEIRAPYDGIVDKLAFSTVGGVIEPAQAIMEIVPQSERLLVEAIVSPADIDRLKNGQQARVRLSAFSAPTTPEISGVVVFVSPERANNEQTGTSYYRVHIRMNEAEIKHEKLDLKPGMPAEVFISTGERSLMSYILKPLRDQFARAFRD